MNSAILAQLVEHITRNDEVVGSIPTNGSRITSTYVNCVGVFFICGLHIGCGKGGGTP